MITKILSQQLPTDYEKFKNNIFSQNGEDGLIEYFLQKMQISTGYFVEFGAWDGMHLSNCANLAKNGWSGCFIEGDSERFTDLQKNYSTYSSIKLVNCFVRRHGNFSLDTILNNVNAPEFIDVLSIDIDGDDYAVWDSISSHQVRLLVIEFNPTIPANLVVIQEEKDDANFGSSLGALWELGNTKGFRLVAVTAWNAFFLSNTDCEKSRIPFYNPWDLKDTTYETFLIQGQNGQIKLAGDKTLLWHGIKLDEEKLQHLPENLRKIPAGQSVKYFEDLQVFKASTGG
jgi:hypothetical protein